MGVLYVAVPVDSASAELLDEAGVTYPGDARWPTGTELRRVLDTLEGCAVEYSTTSEGWDADVTDITTGEDTTLWIEQPSADESPVKFSFHKGDCRLAIRIVRCLTEFCGPYVMLEGGVGSVAVVTPDSTLADVEDTIWGAN